MSKVDAALGGRPPLWTLATHRDFEVNWHHPRLAKVYEPGTLEHLRSLCDKTAFAPRRVSGQEMTCFLGPVMFYT
jgi:hypothetical protein